MSYPTLRGLAIEDFKNLSPETRQGLEQLLFSLNPFLADTSDLLGGRLSLANHAATLKEVSFSMPDGWVPLLENEATSPSFNGKPWPSCRWEGREVVYRGAGAMPDPAVTSGDGPYQIPAGYLPASNLTFPGVYRGTPFTWEIGSNGSMTINYTGSISEVEEDLSVEGIRYPGAGPIPPLPSPFPLKVSHNLTGKPSLVLPVLCLDCTGNTITPAPVPRLTWGHSEGGITIYRMDGLPDSRNYRLVVLIAS